MSDVFISYAHENRAEAQALADALQARGLSVFWDRTILTGQTFDQEIERAIGEAKAVVVLWSQHSVHSDWVRAEAAEGTRRGLLVPATLDGISPPLRYRITQTANLADWTPGQLTESFEALLQDVGATVAASPPEGAGASEKDGSFSGRWTDAQPRAPISLVRMRQFLMASMTCAWMGSTALTFVLAKDFGVFDVGNDLWRVALGLTVLAFVVGSISCVMLGVLSLRIRCSIGVLQGWVWPIVSALGQVAFLALAAWLLPMLPFGTHFEVLMAFILCGAISPALLSVGAIIADRSFERVCGLERAI